MKFKTLISSTKKGAHSIRGHVLTDLIGEHSFVDMIFLLLRGTMPDNKERQLLDAMLIAATEHGIHAPSVFVPRVSASVGNDVHTALAAGILAMGPAHGLAIEPLATILSSKKKAERIVAEHLKAGKHIPGFGHKVYVTEDPRARLLHEKALSLKLPILYFERAYQIERALVRAKGTKFPLNVDGAIAASVLTLGFKPDTGNVIFILPRLLGIAAHVLEEREQNNSYYRLDDNDVVS